VVLVGLTGAIAPTTASAVPPTVLAEAPTEIGYTTARAHGLLDPGAEEAFYRFEYIADPLFDRNLAKGEDPFTGAISDGSGWLPAGAGAVSVAPLLGESGGLAPGVEYDLRLLAEDQDGSAVALAPSFTTPEPLDPIPCLGDNCQVLPPEPRDPPLSTTAPGLGNPMVHYTRYGSKKSSSKRGAGKPHHAAPRHKPKGGGRHPGKASE
jgi:hypothetical protein